MNFWLNQMTVLSLTAAAVSSASIQNAYCRFEEIDSLEERTTSYLTAGDACVKSLHEAAAKNGSANLMDVLSKLVMLSNQPKEVKVKRRYSTGNTNSDALVTAKIDISKTLGQDQTLEIIQKHLEHLKIAQDLSTRRESEALDRLKEAKRLVSAPKSPCLARGSAVTLESARNCASLRESVSSLRTDYETKKDEAQTRRDIYKGQARDFSEYKDHSSDGQKGPYLAEGTELGIYFFDKSPWNELRNEIDHDVSGNRSIDLSSLQPPLQAAVNRLVVCRKKLAEAMASQAQVYNRESKNPVTVVLYPDFTIKVEEAKAAGEAK